MVQFSRELHKKLQQIQRRFDKHTALPNRDCVARAPLSTGVQALDDALNGGLLPGTITAFLGDGTTGRHTFAQHIVAPIQDEVVVYLDVSEAFDAESAIRNGINLNQLIIVRPKDQCSNLLGELLKLPIPVIVLDEGIASASTKLSTSTIFQLHQSDTILLALPSFGQDMPCANSRLFFEHVEWIYRDRTDIIGCRSRVTVAGTQGESVETSVLLDFTFRD